MGNQPIPFLDVSQCIANRHAGALESEAVLLSLLSISAIHQSSISLQRAKFHLTTDLVGRWGTPTTSHSRVDRTNENLRELGNQLGTSALHLCRVALLLKLPTLVDAKTLHDASLMVMSSCISIIISQVMLCGSGWRAAFDLALEVIGQRGGPATMLKAARRSSRAAWKNMTTVIDILTIVDVCHCLSTMGQPRLLEQPFQPWW